ncbi:MAG TPA: response regulator transcription factor [Ktedonobacterales bacterium]|nr:response regulator transcription factor [Ktedonobacterales bacterium]
MKVLLTEDELSLARTYQRHLERAGHRVEVYTSAEAVYERLADAPDEFDILVLDVLLPGMSGIELTRRLRRDGYDIPILMLTALGQNSDVVAGLDAGADDYLTKPFPVDVLLARLRALGRRPRTFDPIANATRIQAGDLLIDEVQHVVYRGAEMIPLTPREFTLLAFLARHANRVLTRGQLMLHVWPEGTEAASNVLDTYIHHLRDKLEIPGGATLIQTVRGVGYALRLFNGERLAEAPSRQSSGAP